jgi:hypothetical protein
MGREETIITFICFLVAYLILFVCACWSISHTNRETIRATCGTSLRDIVLADAILGSLGVIVYMCEVYLFWCSRSVAMITGTIFLLAIGAASIGIYIDAERTPSCQEILYNIRSEINTPNPHEGEVLLSIMAMICGIVYVVCGLWVFFIYWFHAPDAHTPSRFTQVVAVSNAYP